MTATPEQLHAALMYCINFARTMLEDSGEFYPFGCFVDESGQVVGTGADMGDEHPQMQDVFGFLTQKLEERLTVGGAIALAVAVNVNIPAEYSPQHADGVRVTLKSRGYSRFVYVPYGLSKGVGARNIVAFAKPFSVGLPT